MEPIKLAEIQPVVLAVEAAEGDIYTVDPYDIVRRLEPLLDNADLKATDSLDQIKAAFDIPDLTDQQAVFLLQKVVGLVREEVQSKEDGPITPT